MTVTRRLTEGDGLQFIEDPVAQRLRLTVRREVVAYLADLLDTSRPDRAAGTIGFNSLIDYPVNTVGGRLKSIITGIGAGQPWGDVDALLADLYGRISLDQLSAPLQDEIDKISASVSEIGSVNQRLQIEELARVQALQDEATARGTAINLALDGLTLDVLDSISAGDSAVSALVTAEGLARTDADAALGVRVDTVSARLNGGGDIATSLAEARSYAYTKAEANSAVAATASTLRGEFADGDSTVNSRVTTEAQASSDRDSALSTRVDTVSARLDSGDIATSLAQAASYAYTKAQSDSAIASASSTLTSAFTGADATINARLNAGGDIANSLATANNYAYTKAQSDSAISSASSTLTAAFTGADATINARLNAGGDIATSLANANSYAYTKAQADSAIASATNTVNARLNGGGDIATALANANSYAYTKAASDAAISTLGYLLSTSFVAGDDAIKARLDSGDIATSLATANSYAYTKAQADGAVASSLGTLAAALVGPGGVISAAVSTEAAARVAETGVLNAQLVFKTVATRSDGRVVLGQIGLASKATNDSTGGDSQVLISADSLVFVPTSDPNAVPVGFLEVGLVNGVATLRIPAARIGDATITTGKMSVPNLAAINADLGTVTAGTITLNSSGYIRGGQTDFDAGVGFFLGKSVSGNDFCFSLRADDGSSMTFSKAGGLHISGATINTQASGPLTNGGDMRAYSSRIAVSGTIYVSTHIELRRDGTIWKWETDGSGYNAPLQIGNWYAPPTATIGDQYQALFTRTGGNSTTGYSSNAASGWVDLDTSRYVQQELNSSATYDFNSTGNYQVRRKSDLAVVCTGTFSLEITRDV